MKRLLALMMTLCGVTALAADGVWIKTDTGTSPLSAANYSAPENWANGYVPGESDSAYFTNAFTATRYVKLPSDLSLASSFATRGSAGGTTDFLGERVTLNSRLSFVGENALVQRWFADITAPNGITLVHSGICGDLMVSAGKDLTFSGGTCYLDFSAYANSDEAVRTVGPDIPRVYSGNCEAHYRGPAALPNGASGVWRTENGSPYLTRVSGTGGLSLAVGGPLSGEGIPAGAYVRRIFSDDAIEMSANASVSSESVSVTFGAFVPTVVVRIPKYCQGASNSQYIEKLSEATDFRLEFDRMESSAASCNLFLNSTYATTVPATLVIHDATAYTGSVMLHSGHILFAENPNGRIGLPVASAVSQYRNDSVATLTVTNGLSAEISVLSQILGRITKDGAGTLVTRLEGDNAGRLIVSGGILQLDPMSDATPSIARLEVAAGATLRLNGGALRVEALALEEGAILDGPGTLVVPGFRPDLSKVVLSGGVQVAIAGSTDAPILAVPAATAPAGVPAFWVDASYDASVVTDGESGVTRWNDRRGAGYPYATNIVLKPKLVEGTFGKYVQMQHLNIFPHWIAEEEVLVWSDIIKNVKAVFAVLDATKEGGYLLGRSARPAIQERGGTGGFFYRENVGWNKPILSPSCIGAADGLYIDGDEVPHSAMFRDTGIQLVEYHNRAGRDIWADAFGTGYADGGQEYAANGGLHAYEYVIYTNDLTMAERVQTAQYLLKKWKSRDVTLSRNTAPDADLGVLGSAVDGGVAIAAGETLAVDGLGTGTLVKGGEGSLFIKTALGGSLHAVGGTTIIRSKPLDVESLPRMEDCWLHFDASKDDSLVKSAQNGTNFVTRWNDRRGNGWYMIKAGSDGGVATSDGWLHENVVNGKPMVDLGERAYAPSAWAKPQPFRALQFRSPTGAEVPGDQHCGGKGPDIYSCFIVYDSSGGGNALLSGRGGGHPKYGFEPAYAGGGGETTAIFNPNNDGGDIYLQNLFYRLRDGMENPAYDCDLLVRQNGAIFNPFKTDFSGGQDVFVYSTDLYPRRTGGLAIQGYDNNVGGLMYGEVLLFTNALGSADTKFVEAYLMKKWKGVDTPGYGAAVLESLAVDAGATVNVFGTAPLTVSSIKAAGGSIVGSVKMASGAIVEIPVLEDGTLGTVTLGADFDFSAGVTVRIVGNVNAVLPGTYTVVTSSAIAADATGWTFSDPGAKRRTFGLAVADGKVQVSVSKFGLAVIVR